MEKAKKYMDLCLKLAREGKGFVEPNPLVGAVIVKNNKIISQGYHKKFGENHAEIEAMNNTSKKSLKGATLYVNLEPCSHAGKTPPCAKKIVESGIKKVIFGIKDPNPLVNGKGKKYLEENGVEINEGILKKECLELNKHFLTAIQKKRPYITLKIAASLDGKIALSNGESKYISDKAARIHAKKDRANYQGILVGINTILKDNPFLESPYHPQKKIKRVLLDPNLKIATGSKVLRDKEFIIFTKRIKTEKIDKIKKIGGEIIILKNYNLQKITRILYEKGIYSVLVDGGGYTFSRFFEEKLYDEINYYLSPIIVGGEKSIKAWQIKETKSLKTVKKIKILTVKKVGETLLLIGK